MASPDQAPPTGEGGESRSTPGKTGKLDTLAREDLIKYVKKQAAQMQKLRAQCDKLSKEKAGDAPPGDRLGVTGATQELEARLRAAAAELAELKEERDGTLTAYHAVQQQQEQTAAAHENLEDALNKVSAEKEDLANEVSSLKDDLSRATSRNKELSEELECMQMKQETMTSTFQFLQEEQSTLGKENEALQEQIRVLTAARDQVMDSLQAFKQQQQREKSSGDAQLQSALSEATAQRDQTAEQLLELQRSQEGSVAEIRELQSKLEAALEAKQEADRAMQIAQTSKEEIYQVQIADLKEALYTDGVALKALRVEHEIAKTERLETQKDRDNLANELSKLREELEAAERDSGDAVQRQSALDELQQVEERLKAVVAEKEQSHNEIEELKSQLEKLSAELKSVNEILCSSEQDKDSSQAMLMDLSEKLEGLRSELLRSENSNGELKIQIDQLTREKDEATEETRTLEQQAEGNEKQLLYLRAELESLRQEKDQAIRDLKEKVRNDETAAENHKKLQEQLDAVQAEKEQLAGEMSTLRQFQESSQDLNKVVTVLQEERNKLATKVTDMGSTNFSLLNEVGGLRKERDQLVARVEEAEKQVSQQSESKRNVEQQLQEELNEAKQEAEELSESHKMALEMAERERDRIREDLEAARNDESSSTHELQEQLQLLRSERDNLADSKLSLDSEVKRLTEDLATAQESLSMSPKEQSSKVEVEKEVTHLEGELNSMEQSNEELQTELVAIREAHLEALNQCTYAENQLKAVKAGQDERLSREKEDLQEKLESLSTDKDRLTVQLQEQEAHLKHRMEEMAATIQDLEREKQQACDDLDSLRETEATERGLKESLETLKQDKETLQGELQAKEIDYKNVIGQLRGQLETVEANQSKVNEDLERMTSKLLHKDSCIQEISEENRVQLEAKQTELNSVKAELEAAQQAKEDFVAKSEVQASSNSTTEELKAKIASLEADKVAFKANFEKLKKASQTKVQRLKDQAEAIQEEKKTLSEKLDTLASCDGSRASQIDELTSLTESLRAEKADLEQRVNSAREEREMLETAKSKLESSLKVVEAERTSLFADLQAALAEQSSQEGGQQASAEMLQDMDASKQKLVNQLQEVQAEVGQKAEEVRRLRADLEKALAEKEKLQEMDASKQKLVNQLQEVQAEVGQKAEEVRRLRADLEKALAEKEKLQEMGVAGAVSESSSEMIEEKPKVRESLQSSAPAGDFLQPELDAKVKQLKDTEEKAQKLRSLAMKVKKELEQAKKQITSQAEELSRATSEKEQLSKKLDSQTQQLSGSRQHIVNYQSLHVEYEKLQDLLDAEKDLCRGLKKKLSETSEDLKNLSTECAQTKMAKEELARSCDHAVKEIHTLERSAAELKSRLLAAEDERDREKEEKERRTQELGQAVEKIKAFEHDAGKQKENFDTTTRQLQAALKDASQSNLMDLEIADYEKTVSNLNHTISEKDGRIVQGNAEIARLEKRIEALQKETDASDYQRAQADERGNKLKALLMKTKKDLADSKKAELDQRANEAALRGQLERLTQQSEALKVDLSVLAAEKQKLHDQIRAAGDANLRTVRGLEQKNRTLQEDLELVRNELASTQEEFESYKVRVHSVLKQQKTRGSSSVDVETELQEKDHLEKVAKQLKAKIQETRDELRAATTELDLLQDEHDRLLQRHSDMVLDGQSKEAAWREKMETLRIESQASNIQHRETIRELTAQNESLTNTFKAQMRHLQDDHHRSLDTLQHQLEMTENRLYRLQKEQQHANQQQQQQQQQLQQQPGRQAPAARNGGETKEMAQDAGGTRPSLEEREQGEGMEYTDAEPSPASKQRLSSAASSPAPLVPLAQLLSEPSLADAAPSLVSLAGSTAEEEQLRAELAAARKKLDHFSEIMSDNEATIMRLTEQAKVLKEEIRRLERNQEREDAITNLEYLKNVVMKFLVPAQSGERQHLIPVLTTMLKLSDKERQDILDAMEGEEIAAGNETKKWGSYLHRWSGGIV